MLHKKGLDNGHLSKILDVPWNEWTELIELIELIELLLPQKCYHLVAAKAGENCLAELLFRAVIPGC